VVLELSPVQVTAVRDLLEARLGGLSSEIRHTDSPRVRQELREERELLRGLLGELRADAA